MTISTDISFSENRDQIIKDAFILLGVDPVESVSDTDNQYAARTLNRMILAWEAQDIHLWLYQDLILFLQKGQNSYNLGASSSDHACIDGNYVETTIATAATANATSFVLASVTGMTVGDNIGIIMDSGTTYWDTIKTINTGTKTVTVNGTGNSSTAAVGNFVHTYTTAANRPLKIYQARRYNYSAATDIALKLFTRDEYMEIPLKTVSSIPIGIYYDPKVTSTGTLYTWATPSDSSNAIKMTVARQIYDFTSATDNMDLPNEWYEPIIYNLAVRLAPAYGKSQQLQVLKPLADEMLQNLKDFDQEVGSIFISPDEQ